MILSLNTIPFKVTTVYAETTNVASGSCGTNVKWVLDNTGTLTIDGSGNMNDFDYFTSPFYSYKDQILTVKVESGVKNIGAAAFYSCSVLTSISLPIGATSIGNSAFAGCNSLTSINLPEGLTIIDDSAFSDCSGLTSINLPDGVTSIGNSAFSGCSGLTNIHLPESLTNIGPWAFQVCSGLTSISLPARVESIGGGAFAQCKNLTNINLPQGIISIEASTFDGCSSLTSISLPEGVTSIGNYAFQLCSSLISINLPSSVISIGDYVFNGCNKLTSISLPDVVTNIGDYAFSECSALTSISMPEGVTSIGNGVFSYSGLRSITLPKGLTSIGKWTFSGCRNLTSIRLPDGVTSIGENAFYSCSSLEKIVLPESLTNIGTSTFRYCQLLKYYVLPNSYAYDYVKSHGFSFFFLVDPSVQSQVQYLSFLDDYQYLKVSDIRLLSDLINYSTGISFQNIIFSISDNSVAMISDGRIAGIGEGECTVTATYGNLSSSYSLKVSNTYSSDTVTGVILNKDTLTINKGLQEVVKATIMPLTAVEREVTWSSSNNSVATVENGIITAVAPGTTAVTASINGYSDMIEITVNAPILDIALDNDGFSVDKNQTYKIYYYIYPFYTTDDKTVTYTSSDESIATVDSNGIVTGVNFGTTSIIITIGSIVKSVKVSVISSLKDISLNKTSVIGIKNSSEQLSVNYDPVDTTDDKIIRWSSDNASIATIDSAGLITMVSKGITTITATVGTHSVNCSVIVTEIPLSSISLDYTELGLMYGYSSNLNVSYEPLNMTDDKTVTWTSSDKSVVTVSSDGTITAVGNGTATITVTTADGMKTATCAVTVENMVTGVTLNTSTTTINGIGVMEKLVGTIAPSDATNQKIIWSSSNTSVATVDAAGKVTSKGYGTAVITATTEDGEKAATCTVTVKVQKNYSGIYNIKSIRSGLVMDVSGGGKTEGTNIIQWTANGGLNQQWKFESLGNGYYKITSVLNPDYSLDVNGGGAANGTRVIQWTYHGGINQQWKIIENVDGSVSLMSRLSAESGTRSVLDVNGGGTKAGVNVIQWTSNGLDNQKWSLVPVAEDYSGIYKIKSKKSGLVMDVNGGGKTEGTNIIQWSANGGMNQQWKFESLGNGYYKITSVLNPTYSLDVNGGGTAIGTKVIQWTYRGATNQQWKIIKNADGSVLFMSRQSVENGTKYVLDVNGGGTTPGVNVIQWTSNGGDNQKWYPEIVN